MFIVYWFSVWYSHSLLFHFSAHRRKWTIPEILLVYKLPYVHTSYHAHISVLPCLITCYVHTSYHTHISVLLCLLTSYVHTPATPISQFSHVCSPVMSTPLPRPHLSSPVCSPLMFTPLPHPYLSSVSAHLLCPHLLPRPYLSSPMSSHLSCPHPCHAHIPIILCLFTCYVCMSSLPAAHSYQVKKLKYNATNATDICNFPEN